MTVKLPEIPFLISNNGGQNRQENDITVFNAIREMKRVLFGNRPVIERVDEEKMEITEEYLSPGNENEVVSELINYKFSWIIQLGSIITWIFHGNGGCMTWTKDKSDNKCWRNNELVSEFVSETIYEFFQLLLRNPEAHANARNCNHLFCSFWPYSVWAYKQIVDKILDEKKEWNNDLEMITKAIWSSYSIDPYNGARTSIDPFKFGMVEEAKNGRVFGRIKIDIGANQVLNKFRQVAINSIKKRGISMPGISILYYGLGATQLGALDTKLIPIDEVNELSFDEKMLLKSEIESGVWQVETSLLIPMSIYNDVDSQSYLERVCQGFFK